MTRDNDRRYNGDGDSDSLVKVMSLLMATAVTTKAETMLLPAVAIEVVTTHASCAGRPCSRACIAHWLCFSETSLVAIRLGSAKRTLLAKLCG